MAKPSLLPVFLILIASAANFGMAQQNGSSTAISILQLSVTAMGSSVPADSTASGAITTTAGSTVENGSIAILTRGLDQSSEQLQTPSGLTTNYSQGGAAQVQGGIINALPFEQTVTAQCSYFPLQLLSNVLNDPDSVFNYVGLETQNGIAVHHIQFWNSFTSNPPLVSLTNFSQRDIWIDATSNLPVQISYSDHIAQGAAAATAVDVTFANFTNFGSVLYPTTIQKSMNGTPWATITITNVSFNTGLTDANFPVN
jgi:hypothetical protein